MIPKEKERFAIEIPGIAVCSSSGECGGGKRPDIDPEWARRWPMMIRSRKGGNRRLAIRC